MQTRFAQAPIAIDFEGEISRLKKDLNAVILAHYYQDSEIQDIADFVGDSLDLSKKAATTDADVIVFCGVRFMAESASILNPGKTVIIPDMLAGCSLEEGCDPEEFKKFRLQNPEYIAITYINCSAEVKALSDIIVTSSNAEKIINSIPLEKKILFAPDKNLGSFLIKSTGRSMKLWDGSCVVHENFSEKELIKIKTLRPKAKIIAHPECTSVLLEYANHVGSTSSLIKYVEQRDGEEFIVLTEPHIIHQMYKRAPNSRFYDVPSISQSGCTMCSQCPYMKLNNIEKVYLCMKNLSPKIVVPKDIALMAKASLDKMLELSK
jgi:quinolinate synthase